jgi:hypothetical protein
VVEVARCMRAALDDDTRGAQVPPAALVWWRAELRLRDEAARDAVRPITAAQAIAAASGVGLAIGLAGVFLPWARDAAGAVQWSAQVLATARLGLTAVPSSVLVLAAAWLVLAPVAAYLVAVDD